LSTLPQINLIVDINGHHAAHFEINPQRFAGIRSTTGAILYVPVEAAHGHPARILMLSGVLTMSGDPDGLMIPAQAFAVNDSGLRVPISDDQLERIEQRRSGAAPLFELTLRGVGSLASETYVLVSNDRALISVPLEKWIEVLAAVGFGQRRLIELPPPPSRPGADWELCVKQIQSASWRLARGDAGAAMTEARTAIERTLEALGSEVSRPRNSGEPFRNYAEALAKSLREMHTHRSSDPYEALADAVQLALSTFGFASHPVHNAFDAAERAHAELTLSIAVMIYTYCGRLLK
jgi:hypothetical protein